MIPDPAHYRDTSVYGLLTAASRGYAGIDRRWLHAIVDRGDQAIPDLVRFAAEDHSEAPVNLDEDLIAIFHHLNTPAALAFYKNLIRKDPEVVLDELIEAMVDLGEPCVEPLLQLYEELGEEQGGDVAFLLAALNIRDPRILKLLTERIDYDATDGAFCLEIYGDPAAIPALEKLASEVEQDPELHTRISGIIDDLRKPDEPVTSTPFNLWSTYSQEVGPAFDILSEDDRLSILDSPSTELRLEAARSFFNVNVDLSAKARKKLLEVARTDANADVRGRAWESLTGALKEPDVRQAIFAALENENTPLEEHTGIVVALAEETDLPKVRKAIERLYEDPKGRAKALEAMWRSFDRDFTPYALKHLDDHDVEIRRQAIWCVGHLGIHSEANRLIKLFENDELRTDSLFAYALAAPVDVKRSRMKELFSRIDKMAEGLSQGEAELVQIAIDERLAMHGLTPVFFAEEEPEEKAKPTLVPSEKPGRNDPCSCGSGKKYKKCCGA